ncbi:MAG TPA: 3-methyl-2-oxobutanoate hydroxymethyltransferase [Vicinamibacterales bacterium]|jgi:3-methyl-2-oxobutanoate hydroxymethyltransferase|nr:3-methyl-2-oxobutanoate hydroxymethyltransferase [Vicinamibacterales bacterium]
MSEPRVRVPDLREKKRRGEKIAVLTAYDATMARLLDGAGVDVLLVGDSVGVVVLGYEHTLTVTLDEMLHHTRAVARGATRALVVADMPFMTYQVSVEEAVRNAGLLLQAGAAAVKVEGGPAIAGAVRRMVEVGIPVMGHLGLQPQSVHQLGGYKRQAMQREEIETLVEDAHALERAGVFAIVLEAVGHDAARQVTAAVSVPTIGIGAGPDCDGQVLVSHDMLGLFDGHIPSFVKQYAHLAEEVARAARAYADDVRAGRFPEAARPLETRRS